MFCELAMNSQLTHKRGTNGSGVFRENILKSERVYTTCLMHVLALNLKGTQVLIKINEMYK